MNSKLKFGLAGALLVIAGTISFLDARGNDLAIQTPMPGWKVFSNPALDVTFQYPEKFGHMNLEVEGKYFGAGIQYEPCLNGRTNCNFYTLTVQAAAADYTPSKGPRDNLSAGYIKVGDKYYHRQTDGGRGPEIKAPVREVQAKNASGIVIMGEGASLAVFNLESSKYAALSIFNPDERELSDADFTKVLESVEGR